MALTLCAYLHPQFSFFQEHQLYRDRKHLNDPILTHYISNNSLSERFHSEILGDRTSIYEFWGTQPIMKPCWSSPEATTEDEPRKGSMNSQWQKVTLHRSLKWNKIFLFIKEKSHKTTGTVILAQLALSTRYTRLCTNLSAASQGQWQMTPARVQAG